MINKCFTEKIDVGHSWDLPPVLDNPRQSIRFWIPYCGFPVLGLYWILYPLSVELGFSIPIISRIPNFFKLYSGFQSLGFRIPQEEFFRVPDSTRKSFFYCTPETGLPYLGQSTAYGFKSSWSPEFFSGFSLMQLHKLCSQLQGSFFILL